MTKDAYEELAEIVSRLQRMTAHHDGVISVQINSDAWDHFYGQFSANTEKFNPKSIEYGQGADGKGKRFEFMGVEFADYNRVTGLSSTRK